MIKAFFASWLLFKPARLLYSWRMAWLDTLFERVKAPFSKGEGHGFQQGTSARASAAVATFAQAACAPLTHDNESLWLNGVLAGLRQVQTCQAQALWLQAVEQGTFPLQSMQHTFGRVRLGLVPEINWGSASGTVDAKMNNVRVTWSTFVAETLAAQEWSIAHWPDRTHWFRALLSHVWPDGKPVNATLLHYAQTMAKKEEWARDLLLEFRVLHLKSSETLDAMFQGPFGKSLPFITAVAGISLRMHQKAPTVAAAHLHRQALAAWPQEMARLEASLDVQALLENKTVAEHAHLAYAMEMSTQGYSPYLPVYGESIHALARDGLAMATPALALPALE